jgi:type IV pilus assembly protein PilY1
MRLAKFFLLPSVFLFLLFPTGLLAKDTDIYMATGEGVQPNILIILDSSISMDDEIPTRQYSKTTVYPGTYLTTKVYKYSSPNWVLFGATADLSDIADIPVKCTTAITALTDNHFATGVYTALNTRSPYKCDQNSKNLRMGNYLNYMDSGGDLSRKKIDISKDTLIELLDSVGEVRVGLMVFNSLVSDSSVHGYSFDKNAHGGKVISQVKSLTTPETHPGTGASTTHKEVLKYWLRKGTHDKCEDEGDPDHFICPDSYTPLAETLYEAGIYFKGGVNPPTDNHGYFNPTQTYTSPIEYSCQKSYVILMSDGDPTLDDGYRPGDSCAGQGTDVEAHHHIFWDVVGDRDGDRREPMCRTTDPSSCDYHDRVDYTVYGSDMGGTDWLDDVAKYLHDTDHRSDLTGTQNITTYTIGFAVTPQHDLLGRTADATHGGGKYFTASDAAELADAFQTIVGEIMEQTTSFVAPIVPVSRMEKETAGDRLYLALFQPSSEKAWSGNIKKFGVSQSGTTIGQIIDSNSVAALDSYGQILDSATSYWPTDVPDGSNVEKGGVGAKLKTRATARNIYTYKGAVTGLTNVVNAFDAAHVSKEELGVATDTDRDNLINFVHGLDAYDADADGNFTEKRSWILGSFLHSRPLIIHYGNEADSQSVIYAGANDGMLHAFDDSDGSELWAFIPPNLLGSLQGMLADVNTVLMDGSAKAYISRNSDGTVAKAILMFGERRGGNRYYALNVTTPDAPTFLWDIGPDGRRYLANPRDLATEYQQMGQTWSSPNVGKVACKVGAPNCINVSGSVGERWVAFISGGYDTNQDNNPVVLSDTLGRAVYIVDVLDGSLVKRFSVVEYPAGSTYPMLYSIPSDISRVDTDGDGKVNTLYVGDMGGQMWRFSVEDPDPSNWTGRIIFQANPGCSPDASTGRKIFYPPDVTLETSSAGPYEMLIFGTGDREHPDEEAIVNRIYALKDKSAIETMAILTECNLYDVTTGELQAADTTQARKDEIQTQLNTAYGWLIKLGTGEKSLAVPVVFFKVAYLTTFSPTGTGDPCQAGFGTARMYGLSYTNGNAAFNFDLSNDTSGIAIRATDRSEVIGTAIPSGVIITFIRGAAVAYTGVGGGVDMPRLTTTKSLVPVNWRIVF